MRDTELLRGLLRVEDPWDVTESQLDLKLKRVDVRLEWKGPGRCPKCDRECPKHDHRERVWRDLDLCSDQLFLHALVPRVDCPEHGVITVAVPWSTGRSEFTARFERLAIALLVEMSVKAVARRLDIGWDSVDGIMMRAVERGKQRRIKTVVRHLGIDEKAFKKGHKYFTIVSDLDKGEVLWVGRGRKRESIDAFYHQLSQEQLDGIEGVAMDMWQPYFESTITHVPRAADKIVFDKFHITAYLTKAVDLTRRALMRDTSLDRTALKGTKYKWLHAYRNLDRAERRELAVLRHEYKRLGRAWSIKENFAEFWRYRSESHARRFFAEWYRWATHSQLPEMVSVARTIKRHFENIITYIRKPITNAASEGLNSKVQMIKYRARGYRNEDRFEAAILFHCGGLDLYPTHSNS
ncbi:MAG TPA: ISL3 family transposase [Geobacterales bacterium]|jgi:transposase|nr:ISL3 family transposase [Geobacterales bacterium]